MRGDMSLKGRLSAVRAGERAEVVKRSHFNAGEMTGKTYENTRAFYAKSGK